MENPLKWQFLNEPLWRWFAFLVAIGMMMAAWRGVLSQMKG